SYRDGDYVHFGFSRGGIWWHFVWPNSRIDCSNAPWSNVSVEFDWITTNDTGYPATIFAEILDTYDLTNPNTQPHEVFCGAIPYNADDTEWRCFVFTNPRTGVAWTAADFGCAINDFPFNDFPVGAGFGINSPVSGGNVSSMRLVLSYYSAN